MQNKNINYKFIYYDVDAISNTFITFQPKKKKKKTHSLPYVI